MTKKLSIEICKEDGETSEILNREVENDEEEELLIESIGIDLDNENKGRYVNEVFYDND